MYRKIGKSQDTVEQFKVKKGKNITIGNLYKEAVFTSCLNCKDQLKKENVTF